MEYNPEYHAKLATWAGVGYLVALIVTTILLAGGGWFIGRLLNLW